MQKFIVLGLKLHSVSISREVGVLTCKENLPFASIAHEKNLEPSHYRNATSNDIKIFETQYVPLCLNFFTKAYFETS